MNADELRAKIEVEAEKVMRMIAARDYAGLALLRGEYAITEEQVRAAVERYPHALTMPSPGHLRQAVRFDEEDIANGETTFFVDIRMRDDGNTLSDLTSGTVMVLQEDGPLRVELESIDVL